MRTSRARVAGIAGALGLLIGWPVLSPGQPVPPAAPVLTPCKVYTANEPLTPAAIVAAMPLPCAPSVTGRGSFATPLDNLQHGFDRYSWLTFVALNSPADGVTKIGEGSGPGKDARAIWETYKQLPDVMLENGADPGEWETRHVPDACKSLDAPGRMIVHIEEETFNQPFKSGPLIDQNGNYALFTIFMNREMFDTIKTNKFYSRAVQRDFAGGVKFSSGTNAAPGSLGAVMLKVSFKVIAGKDDPAKFHTVDALIYTPEKKNPQRDATCVAAQLGMIGFHAAHKTQFASQWVWTSFEHVNNVPDLADAIAQRNLLEHYHFYNRECDPIKCPINQLPPKPWDPRVQPFPNGYKSQIARVIPVTADAARMNGESQAVAGIKGTVWENYMLLSTQWPTDTNNKIDLMGVPAPTYLANTTLETYSQGSVPLASSSCIACHLNATSQQKSAQPSDFTFILEKAR